MGRQTVGELRQRYEVFMINNINWWVAKPLVSYVYWLPQQLKNKDWWVAKPLVSYVDGTVRDADNRIYWWVAKPLVSYVLRNL